MAASTRRLVSFGMATFPTPCGITAESCGSKIRQFPETPPHCRTSENMANTTSWQGQANLRKHRKTKHLNIRNEEVSGSIPLGSTTGISAETPGSRPSPPMTVAGSTKPQTVQARVRSPG
ncbi:hypothetical protein MTBSS4_430020 [Magnetospirillum sp. SS-4]|nr:hypothetical protein MTBSS4_430020 [Magnetospirillum sp. SS-4]